MRLYKKQDDARQIVLFFLYIGAKRLLKNRKNVTNTEVYTSLLYVTIRKSRYRDILRIFYG